MTKNQYNKIRKDKMVFLKENRAFFYLVFFVPILLLFTQCAKDDKRPENMSFDELKQKTLTAIEKKKNDDAIEYLEKMVAQNPDNDQISEWKLKLADLYFDSGNLPSAQQMYEHFSQFYPADPKTEYAHYRAVLSKFYQTLRIDCDQTDTQEAIKLCNEYLAKPNFEKYKSDIKDIQKTCEHKLIDKEVYVYDFYLKKGNYAAAQKRLKDLKENYLPKNPDLEARMIFLECKLADKQKDSKILSDKLEELMSKYPDSQFTTMAKRLGSRDKFEF
jgi:outer membrane protein assembly factor BamD